MHWTRKTIYSLLTIFILLYFLYFYIQNIFLPVQFKNFVTGKAQEFLDRPVTIEKMHFSPWRGFIVRNITVYQKDDPGRVFLQADQLSFHILLTPLIQKKVVLIPSIEVDGPFIQIVREGPQLWNFSDLLARKSSPGKSAWTIAPRKILIKNGEIAYTDETTARPFREVVSNIDLDVRVSINKTLRFNLDAQVPRQGSFLNVKGNYFIDSRKLSLRLLAKQLALGQYAALVALPQDLSVQDGVLSAIDLNMNLEAGALQSQGSLTLKGVALATSDGKKINTDLQATNLFLTFQEGRLRGSGDLSSSKTEIVIPGGRTFSGKINGSIKDLDNSTAGTSARGRMIVEGPQVLLGENQAVRAQSFTMENITLRKDDRGLRLQTALSVAALDALFSQRRLQGNVSTQKTDLTFENGEVRILSDLQLTGARLAISPEQSLQTDLTSARTQFTFSGGGYEIESDLKLADTLAQLTPQISFKGRPEGSIIYKFTPAGEANLPPSYSYQGNLNLNDGALAGVPYVDTIQKIAGKIQFEPDRLSSEALDFQTLGTDIQIVGSLTGFSALSPVDNLSHPMLKFTAQTERFDVQKLFAAFPDLAQKTQVTPSGTAAMTASYQGDIRNPAAGAIEVKTKLQEITIKSAKLPSDLTGITGDLNYQKDLVTWKNLTATFEGKQYTLSGQFADFSRPVVDLVLASQDLNATAQLKILNQAFQIIFLSGKYLNSSIDVKGDVHLRENNEPDLDIRGTFTLNIEDFAAFAKDQFEKLKPKGMLTGEGLFKGRPKQWQDWDLTFIARAPTVSLKNFNLDGAELQYDQRDQHVSKCALTGRIYNGELNISASADLTKEDIPGQLNAGLDKLDLALLRESNLPENKFLAGEVSALLSLNGGLKDRQQWKGGGSIEVVNGHLLQWNLLDGLLGAILIPEFGEVVFTDGRSDFTIADGKVYTQDTTLRSNAIDLQAKGWIDFEQNINLDVTPNFDELAAVESESLKKVPSLLLSQGGYVSVKVTGTLSKPQYKVQPLPFKVIEKTTDFLRDGLKEGVGGILKEIF